MNMTPWIVLLAIQFTLGVALGGTIVWIYLRRTKMIFGGKPYPRGFPSGFCIEDVDPTAEIEEGYWGLYGTWKDAAEIRGELIGHRLQNYYDAASEGDMPSRDDIKILPVWIGNK